jgi:hypothetical protein
VVRTSAGGRRRQQVRAGAPDRSLTANAGLAAVTSRMLSLLPVPRAAALTGGPVTIDLDTTDMEVYGRKKRGVAYNHRPDDRAVKRRRRAPVPGGRNADSPGRPAVRVRVRS